MNSLISKLLGTAVGVKIGNDTIIGLLVGVAWDEKFTNIRVIIISFRE